MSLERERTVASRGRFATRIQRANRMKKPPIRRSIYIDDEAKEADSDDEYINDSNGLTICDETKDMDIDGGNESDEKGRCTFFDEIISCENCHRSEGSGGEHLDILFVSGTDFSGESKLALRRKWCSFRSRGKGAVYSLCYECRKYLSQSNDTYDCNITIMWPSYMWKHVLANEKLDCSLSKKWRFLPLKWRLWWIDAIVQLNGGVSAPFDLQLHLALECVDDEMKEWEEVRGRNIHGLIRMHDIHCSYDVLCPWGCTDSVSRCGGVPLDTFYHRYLSFGISRISHHVGMRYTSISDGGKGSDVLRGAMENIMNVCSSENPAQALANPKWPLRLCIVMSENDGPFLLTCRNHDGGSDLRYLHPPYNPINNNIPASHPDQIGVIGLAPRRFKAAQVKSHTNKSAMFGVDFGYYGCDSINFTTDARFDYCSEIEANYESLAVYGRSDIRNNIDNFVRTNVITRAMATMMKEEADNLVRDENDKDCGVVVRGEAHAMPYSLMEAKESATYIPAADALKMQKYFSEDHFAINRERNSTTGEMEVRTFVPSWQPDIILCHPFSGHGQMPYVMESSLRNDVDSRLLFLLLSLCTAVPEVWSRVVESVSTVADWQGWFLKFATYMFSNHVRRRSSRNDPYKLANIGGHEKKIDELMLMERLKEAVPKDYRSDLFDPSHVRLLPRYVSDIMAVDCNELSQYIFDKTICSSSILIVYRNSCDKGRALLERILMSDDNRYELRYVFSSEYDLEEKGWIALVTSRWGGPMHQSWWRQTRNKKRTDGPIHLQKLENVDLETLLWDVAVYIRESSEDYQQLRMEYLDGIGGQSKCFCQDHDYPLVHCPCSDKYKCVGCGRKASFQCPYPRCSLFMCSADMKKYDGEDGKVYLGLPVAESYYMDSSSMDASLAEMPQSGIPEYHVEDVVDIDIKESGDSLPIVDFVPDYLPNDPPFEISLSDPDAMSESVTVDVGDAFTAKKKRARTELLTTPETLPATTPSPRAVRQRQLSRHDIDNDASIPSSRRISYHELNGNVLKRGEVTVEDTALEDISFANEFDELDGLSGDEDDNILDDMSDISVGGNLGLVPGSDELSDIDEDDLLPWTDTRDEIPIVVSSDLSDGYGIVPGHVLLNKYANCLVRKDTKLVGSNGQRGFIERLVATAKGVSVPLLYPEGMMFPSIFWWMNHYDGSILGSLPLSLWASQSEARKLGFAGVMEHIRCRMTNPRSLCGMDSRYTFLCYDIMSNIKLRVGDSRFMQLTRGWEDLVRQGIIMEKGISVNEGALPGEGVDDRRTVKMLAALTRETPMDFFLTFTCNQKQHFGVAPVHKWIEYLCDKIMEDAKIDESDKAELCAGIRNSGKVAILRKWLDVGEDFMEWLINSLEEPYGKILRYFWRWEFQGYEGNLPHIHFLGALEHPQDICDEEKTARLFDKIICSTRAMISPEVLGKLDAAGFIDAHDEDAVEALREDFEGKQMHSCAASRGRCMRKTGPNPEDKKCRYPHYGLENFDSEGFKEIRAPHDEATMDLFQRLGFVEIDADSGAEKYIPEFVAGRFVYEADADEHCSPCNPLTFAATRSSQNAQVCSNYTTARYLGTYVASMDERHRIKYEATANGKIEVKNEEVVNTKITSSKRARDRADQKEEQKSNHGYLIGEFEAMTEILGISFFHTDASFITLPNVPLEERPTIGRSYRAPQREISSALPFVEQLLDFCAGGVLVGSEWRRNTLHLPGWRCFTKSQEMMMADLLQSEMTVDAISAFSVRPPELFFVKSVADYLRFFRRLPREMKANDKVEGGYASATQLYVKKSLKLSAFVDGMECQVLVRPPAVAEILKKYKDCTEFNEGSRVIFEFLDYRINSGARPFFPEDLSNSDEEVNGLEEIPLMWENDLHKSLVDDRYTDRFLPITVTEPVRPRLGIRFLISLLYSLGNFDTEYDLFLGSTWADFFANADLVPRNSVTENDVDTVLKRYILEQLLYLPGGTKAMDHHCVTADSVLKSALLKNEIPIDDVPPCLYTMLRQHCTEKGLKRRYDLRRSVIECAWEHISHQSVPGDGGAEVIISATKSNPLSVNFSLQRGPYQSMESYEEQCKAMKEFEIALRKYADPSSSVSSKCFFFAGYAGAGKTYMLRTVVCKAAALGMNVLISAFPSERALELGSVHLSVLFNFKVETDPKQMASRAILRLNRDPVALFLLQTADILCIDEAGLVPAAFFGAMDIVLRHIRYRDDFMGGLWIVASLDVNQIPPIDAIPILASPLALTNVQVVVLKHSVRHTTPEAKQMLQVISNCDPSREDINSFLSLLDNCSYVSREEAEELSPDIPRVYARWGPAREEEKRVIQRLQKRGVEVRYRKAEDVEVPQRGQMTSRPASASVVRKLERNSRVKNVSNLAFYPKMIVEMTHNKRDKWSNGQLAIIFKVPSAEDLATWQPVELLLAPEGTKKAPNASETEEILIEKGWKPLSVRRQEDDRYVTVGTMLGRRYQYPFRPRIAMTIHKVMGADMDQIITSVTDDRSEPWMAEQAVVLMTRTHQLKDVIFVGDKEETKKVMARCLFKQCRYRRYLNNILGRLSRGNGVDVATEDGSDQRGINLSLLPWRTREVDLPGKGFGVVYILISAKNHRSTYIGSTEDLSARLRSHHSGHGSRGTASANLRPWALLAFVVGFENKSEYLSFEKSWKNARDRNGGMICSAERQLSLGEALVESRNKDCGLDLRFVRNQEQVFNPSDKNAQSK